MAAVTLRNQSGERDTARQGDVAGGDIRREGGWAEHAGVDHQRVDPGGGEPRLQETELGSF